MGVSNTGYQFGDSTVSRLTPDDTPTTANASNFVDQVSVKDLISAELARRGKTDLLAKFKAGTADEAELKAALEGFELKVEDYVGSSLIDAGIFTAGASVSFSALVSASGKSLTALVGEDFTLAGLVAANSTAWGFDAGKAIALLDDAIALLDEVLSSPDLARLLFENAGLSATQARDAAVNELNNQISQLNLQAAELEDSAKTLRASAVTQLVLGVIASTISIGAGAYGLGKSIQTGRVAAAADRTAARPGLKQANGTTSPPIPARPNHASLRNAADTGNSMIRSVQELAHGVSGALNAASQYVGTTAQADVKQNDANAARNVAQAKVHEANQTAQLTIAKDIRELFAQIRDFLASIQTADVEALRATTR